MVKSFCLFFSLSLKDLKKCSGIFDPQPFFLRPKALLQWQQSGGAAALKPRWEQHRAAWSAPCRLTAWGCTQWGGLCPVPQHIDIQCFLHGALCQVPAHSWLSPVLAHKPGPAVPQGREGSRARWVRCAGTDSRHGQLLPHSTGAKGCRERSPNSCLQGGAQELCGGDSLFPEC